MRFYNPCTMKIAVDGVAGVGKSTIARLLAERLGVLYVNTGAMYRAVAWGERHGLSLDDMRIRVQAESVWVNDRDVTDELYNAAIDQRASQLATQPRVRRKLIALQRQIAREHDVVMEGRDIGSVVLPDADLKLYLTASVEERARRRSLQRGVREADVREELLERDLRDGQGFGRTAAEDAVWLDTEGLDAAAVVDEVIGHLKKRKGVSTL